MESVGRSDSAPTRWCTSLSVDSGPLRAGGSDYGEPSDRSHAAPASARRYRQVRHRYSAHVFWTQGALILAVVLAAAGSWLVAWFYRRGVMRLMAAPAPSGQAERPGLSWTADAVLPPRRVTLHENLHARRSLVGLLIALSLLMAATAAAVRLALMNGGELLSLGRWLVLTALGTWPVVVVLGLIWRWSRGALLLAVIPWVALAVGIVVVRSVGDSALSGGLVLVLEDVLVPLLLIVLLCLGNTTRAIGPWLVLPVCVGLASSVAGVEFALLLLDQRAGLVPLQSLVATLGGAASIALFAVLPWLVIWWPLYWLGQALAGTYARKQLSELMMLFAVVWFIALAWQAAGLLNEAGVGVLLCFLPLAWVPPVVSLTSWLRRRRTPDRPPTMLVLRVFRREAQVQRLFDHVIERWRLTGNTVLIAAPDLLERTIDADAIFTFLDGGLDGRFIRRQSDIAVRVGLFDFRPDAEGRYRVNECYCNDHSWQEALNVLIRFADVVLMDLRGFGNANAGSAYELGLLARAQGLGRVVLLHDTSTDLSAARELVSAAPAGRIFWLDISGRMNRRRRDQVLAQLFAVPS